jgi:hypothetical protein
MQIVGSLAHRKEFPMSDPLKFFVDGHELTFEQVPLFFIQRRGITDVFTRYKEKTLRETLKNKHYKKLAEAVTQHYASGLDKRLGVFLLELRQLSDPFYAKFLNDYGDREYCEFYIQGDLVTRKGLYCYTVDGEVRYIGRSLDLFKKRVNQGYGVIHPKNCYRDGQATNCHLNSLIAEETGEIEFWVCPLESDWDIKELEERLIKDRQPNWNTALTDKKPEVQSPPNRARPVFIVGVALIALGLVLVAMSFCRYRQSL